jgi:6-pyruvoyl-tetrahydropterin synthase
MRATALPFRSTAENLAKWIYTELKREIPDLASVKVFETADSYAEYSA